MKTFELNTTISNLQSLRESRSEEHTSELQSRVDLVCRLLLEKKKTIRYTNGKLHANSRTYSPHPSSPQQKYAHPRSASRLAQMARAPDLKMYGTQSSATIVAG